MHSLIIHLPRATQRRANAEKLANELPGAVVIDAVDGSDPKQIAGVQVSKGDLYQPSYPFALRPAEIGVFLSHRKCWQKIVDAGWDYAIIVEDDLQIDDDGFLSALRLVEQYGKLDMYVRLPVKAREKPAEVLGALGEIKFILPRVVGLQCIAQVVGRDAAKKLLAATVQIDRPVDTFLQMHWASDQPIHTILPIGNREIAADIGGSTIQVKPTGSKVKRELQRAWYRAQLALRPQKS
jgi:GR25 family glycosyltransferase involved in LPS biosynthesis